MILITLFPLSHTLSSVELPPLPSLHQNPFLSPQSLEPVRLGTNKALKLAKKAVVIKKGEHGALLSVKEDGKIKHFNAPGYPLEKVKDPTGCGDTFGGGFIGYLAKTNDHSDANLRKAVIYGSVLASFNAEDFSLNKQKAITQEHIDRRFNEIKDMREF